LRCVEGWSVNMSEEKKEEKNEEGKRERSPSPAKKGGKKGGKKVTMRHPARAAGLSRLRLGTVHTSCFVVPGLVFVSGFFFPVLWPCAWSPGYLQCGGALPLDLGVAAWARSARGS
jgi:hypothetical protein